MSQRADSGNGVSQGGAAQTGPGATTPTRFGRYRLRGVLGQGGMGRLYVAEQNSIVGIPKIVALKRILPHLADNPQLRAMFLDEARIATELKHRNIVETYEFGEVDGTCFIAMEYLSGEDLAAVLALCKPEPMPIDIALALIQQCAEGLHHAHEGRDAEGRPLGLVHRDVNPWNIFVTYYGSAKLLDFGIAKNRGAKTRTAPGVFKGKYAYSAPEQIAGKAIDPQTDVFGLGIVLWECLTGRKLFEGATEAATIDAVRSRPVPPPSSLRAQVPQWLDAVVMAALQRDRKQRPESARAFGTALASLGPGASPAALGAWMQGLFGQERAALRNVISHGVDVESAITRLAALGVGTASIRTDGDGQAARSAGGTAPRPRTLWSTGAGSASGEAEAARREWNADAATPAHGMAMATSAPGTPGPVVAPARPPGEVARPARRGRVAVGLALAGVIAIGFSAGTVVFRKKGADAPVAATTSAPVFTGELLVRSQPAGAHITVDGAPTGRVTPAVLTGLPAGQRIEVRVEKPGHAPAVQMLDVRPGRAEPPVITLVESVGTLHLAGVPDGAKVYLDDAEVDGRAPLSVPLGPHRLRIETAVDVVYSGAVDIRRGEQTVTIAAPPPAPPPKQGKAP